MAKVLGQGLEALIKTYNTDIDVNISYPKIPIRKIVPNKNQPRNKFDATKMESLAKSIAEKGILQPLTVRKNDSNEFELIAGERRLRAAKKVGLLEVPVYIINISNESEMMELALIENIQRVDLNPMEEAEGYAILRGKYGFTQSKIAISVSKSRSEIANKLRLLRLPPQIQEGLKNKKVEYGHARALLGFRKSSIMLKLYTKIIKSNLNVRQTEELIKTVLGKTNTSKRLTKNYMTEEKKLHAYLNTKISIKNTSKEKGQIVIKFNDKQNLKDILKKIYE